MKIKTTKKKHSIGKIVALCFFFTFGILVIALSVLLAINVFFVKTVHSEELSRNLSDFVTLYGSNQSGRDLPEGLKIMESKCIISEDGKTYAYTLTLKNTTETDNPLALQLFYNERYIAEYGKNIHNPMVRLAKDDNAIIHAGESKTFTITGIIIGRNDSSVSVFQNSLNGVYLEIIYAKQTGRISVPVEFV